MARARFAEILRLLATNEVEFIVVGLTAGILQGAPVTTIDLDVVHRRSPDNVARLLRALATLEAIYRHDPRRLRPQESHLASPGHQLLTTTLGDLDCLGAIGEGHRLRRAAPEDGAAQPLRRAERPGPEPACTDRGEGACGPPKGPGCPARAASHPRRAEAAALKDLMRPVPASVRKQGANDWRAPRPSGSSRKFPGSVVCK